MLCLKNPFKIFRSEIKKDAKLNAFCLLTEKKFYSFETDTLQLLEKNVGIKINDLEIRSPMDKNQLIKCKYIQFHL